MNIPAVVRRFGAGAPMSPSEAGAATRTAYAISFVAQTALALVVGGFVALLSEPPGDSGSSVVGTVLAILGAAQGPAGLAAALLPAHGPADAETIEARRAALRRTLLSAVLLSTPAWYLAFLLASGGGGWPPVALSLMLAAYAFAGSVVATRVGARAADG